MSRSGGGRRGRSPFSQRGVALITALLVVALATVAAVSMASRLQLDVRRAANLLETEQAQLYLLGAESWGIGVLHRHRQSRDTDALGDDWAVILPPLPVDGGDIAGRIEDMQARFNLNNVVAPTGEPSPPDVAILQRLLRLLELDPQLVQAVIDWVDSDIDPQFPDGAEDDYYLRYDPPYRAANRPMASVSELRLIRGVDGEVYERLAPHVAALPERTVINVNTAEPTVLMALSEELDEGLAQAIVEARGEDGFADIEAFLRVPGLADLDIDRQAIGVASAYFRLTALARIGRSRAHTTSLLGRAPDGTIRVLYRSRGGDL
jgi:general secretion pathway protein K